jgi:hypothetical protein
VAGISNDHGSDSKQLSFCTGLTLDSSNTLYIADYENNRIQQRMASSSNSTTIIGEAQTESNSTLAPLNFPSQVAIDLTGNIYVVDSENHRVQLWTPNDSIGRTIAGTGKKSKAHILSSVSTTYFSKHYVQNFFRMISTKKKPSL